MSTLSAATAGPAHRVQSAVEEYGYPQGHLGHLNADQEAAFKGFKLVLEEKGLYKPGTGEEEPGTHDDATLLRFLRARRFVVKDALKQFEDTEVWRKANQLDQLYETIDLEQYEETRRLYPQWTGRRDRRGIPVYVYEVRHLNAKTMAAYEKSAKETHSKAQTDGKTPAKLLRLFALYENLIRFVMPLCTALTDRDHPRTPITQSNNIVDISGVGLKQFWNLRNHMQDASTLATAHYPETLDRIFIIGAPAFFPTVWGWIKKWFDPITTSKIFILSHHEVKKTLESFIDPKNIPKKYGGELEFKFGDKPVLDPELAKVLKWEGERDGFPIGPMFWVNKGEKNGNEMEAIAVGSIEKVERNEKVCTVTKLLGQNEDTIAMNGHATTGDLTTEKETQHPDTPTISEPNGTAASEEPVIQEGEVIPASRPEPVSFVTANEGLNTLSLNEKSEPLLIGNGNITGPHSTLTANLLDPNVNPVSEEGGKEDAQTHDKNDVATGGGVEEADKAHEKKVEVGVEA